MIYLFFFLTPLVTEIGFSNSNEPIQPYNVDLYSIDLPEQVKFDCSLKEKSKQGIWTTKCRYNRMIAMNFNERARYLAEAGKKEMLEASKKCKKNGNNKISIESRVICDSLKKLKNPETATIEEWTNFFIDMYRNMENEAKKKGHDFEIVERLQSSCSVSIVKGKIEFNWDGVRWVESGTPIGSCGLKYDASLWKKDGIWHFEKNFNKYLSTNYSWCKPDVKYYQGKTFILSSSIKDQRLINCRYLTISEDLSGYKPIF